MSNKFGIDNSNWKGGLPKCKECGKQLANYNANYCKKHSQVGSRSPGWIGETPCCKKCGKTLSRKVLFQQSMSGLCHTCYMSGENNHAWKGGKAKCKDCSKLLTSYRRIRCKKCSKKHYKGQNTYLWGKRGPERFKKETYNYDYVHLWLKQNFGKAKECENLNCPKKSSTFQWAKLTNKPYKPIREYYIQLCLPCHRQYDWGKIKL